MECAGGAGRWCCSCRGTVITITLPGALYGHARKRWPAHRARRKRRKPRLHDWMRVAALAPSWFCQREPSTSKFQGTSAAFQHRNRDRFLRGRAEFSSHDSVAVLAASEESLLARQRADVGSCHDAGAATSADLKRKRQKPAPDADFLTSAIRGGRGARSLMAEPARLSPSRRARARQPGPCHGAAVTTIAVPVTVWPAIPGPARCPASPGPRRAPAATPPRRAGGDQRPVAPRRPGRRARPGR